MLRTFKECVDFLNDTGKSWQIHYDIDYGLNEKSGYSIIVDNIVIVAFEPILYAALLGTCDQLQTEAVVIVSPAIPYSVASLPNGELLIEKSTE